MPLPGALGAPRRLILDTAMSTIPLTTTGAELLRQELHRLKTVERPNAITAIAEARTHGDLSENAESEAGRRRGALRVRRHRRSRGDEGRRVGDLSNRRRRRSRYQERQNLDQLAYRQGVDRQVRRGRGGGADSGW